MINILTLALTHVLMALAGWRLLARGDLDDEAFAERAQDKPWLKNRAASGEEPGDA